MQKSALWLVAVLILAAFFRFWDLKNVPPGLWADEAVNGVNTLQALETGHWKVFYPENFGREGLFINIQSLFVAALGTEPLALRLPSAIFGVLTVLGLYLMIKELFYEKSEARSTKRETNSKFKYSNIVSDFGFRISDLTRGEFLGLISSFFLATSFWHINFSRIGFRAIMAPFFLVWAFYFLFYAMRQAQEMKFVGVGALSRTLDEFKIKSEKGLSKFQDLRLTLSIAIAGLLFGAGFHTYIAYRIAPIIALYPLWIFYKNYRAGKLRDDVCAPCLIALFMIIAILAASPLLIYYAKNPTDFFGRTAGISILQSSNPLAQFSENFVKTIGMFNFFGDFNWRHNLAGAPQLRWPVGLLFLLGLWMSIKIAANPKSQAPNHKQYQNYNDQNPKPFRIWDFRNWNLFGIWNLEFGILGSQFAYKFILLWFVVMLVPVAISNEGLPHALRAIVLIPPAMIFAALGLEYIIENWKPARPALATTLLFIFFIAATAHTYNTYFNRWAANFNVYNAFQTDITEKARWLKNQPHDIKKYVVTDAVGRADLRGTPMSFQPMIFIAGTKNIEYLGTDDFDSIDCPGKCIIVPIESKPTIYKTLKQKIPGLRLDASPEFVVLKK